MEPRLVAQIAFTERTRDGILRHPAYLGLRSDKPARQVQAQAVVTMGKNADPDEVAGVRLTNPERVLFSGAGLTKLDLAEYFLAVSTRMLPYASNRPISLVRCPEGDTGPRFFQKHLKKGMPPALKPVSIVENDGDEAEYLMVDDAAGLVSIAQIGGLEIHPWGARVGNVDHPERLIFDLDPDPSVDFAGVRDAARDVRRLLQAADLESYALITGGKGIHVIAPLDGKQDWDTVKSFARGVAEKLAETEPDRFVATMSKAKRRGRIFIDWLRNERGATAVAPYSTARKTRSQRCDARRLGRAVAHRSGQRLHDPVRAPAHQAQDPTPGPTIRSSARRSRAKRSSSSRRRSRRTRRYRTVHTTVSAHANTVLCLLPMERRRDELP